MSHDTSNARIDRRHDPRPNFVSPVYCPDDGPALAEWDGEVGRWRLTSGDGRAL